MAPAASSASAVNIPGIEVDSTIRSFFSYKQEKVTHWTSQATDSQQPQDSKQTLGKFLLHKVVNKTWKKRQPRGRGSGGQEMPIHVTLRP